MRNQVSFTSRRAWTNKRSIRLVAAVVCLLLLLIPTQLFILGLQRSASPLSSASQPLIHRNGTIQSIQQNRSFVLKTRDGQQIQLFCERPCYLSFPHLERHLREHAQTDVYYYLGQEDHLPYVFYAD